MRTKRTKGYIEETAQKHGLRPSQVKEVADSMFEFVAEIISEGNRIRLNFPEIRLMKWGLFTVRESKRKQFKKVRDGRKRTKTADGGS